MDWETPCALGSLVQPATVGWSAWRCGTTPIRRYVEKIVQYLIQRSSLGNLRMTLVQSL